MGYNITVSVVCVFSATAHRKRLYEKAVDHFLAITSVSLRDRVRAHWSGNSRSGHSATISNLLWHKISHQPSIQLLDEGGAGSELS